MEREMAVAITGSSLASFDGNGGSNAMALTLDKISQRLTRSDAKAVYNTLRRDLVLPFCYYNFDRADLAPHLEPIIREPDDLKVAAETIKTLVDAGTPVPVRYVYDRFQIPAPQEGDQVLAPIRAGLQMATRERRARLASGDTPADNPGFVNGALFTDELLETSVHRAVRIMQDELELVLAAVEQAEDYPTLRRNLQSLFADLDPTALTELTEHALLLADLGGRAAVAEDA